MAGKDKHRKEAEADFFGDANVDWLTDDEERAAAAARGAASAPPPPPPPPALRTATPLAGDFTDAAWSNRVRKPNDPRPLSEQPTLVFSDVPTLPPTDSPFAPPRSPAPPAPSAPPPRSAPPAADLSAGLFDEAPLTDPEPSITEAETVEVTHARALPLGDAPTAPTEIQPRPEPAVLAQATPPGESGAPAEPPNDLDGAGEPSGDLVTDLAPRPPTPLPSQVDTVESVRPPRALRSAPPPARPPIPARAPSPPPASWHEVLALLEAERAAAEPSEAGALCAVAGWIALCMAGAPQEADQWFDRARASGHGPAWVHRQQAEARAALGRFADQEASLVALAEASEDVDRSEALLEAGLLAWRRRNRVDEAVQHFERAAAALPQDYTSRALLRALLPTLGRDTWPRRLALLSEVAALSERGVRADALVERATVAEELGLFDDAVASLRGALEAEPGNTFAHQRIERALAHDPPALARYRAGEAERPGQPDLGFWRWREAAAWRAAGDTEAAAAALDAAVAAGWPCAREREALFAAQGEDGRVEALLAAEVAAGGSADLAFRLGVVRELSGDLGGALEAFRACVALDAAAFPAAEAVARLARRTGAESVDGWRSQLAGASPDEARAVRLRVAELSIAARSWADARRELEALAAEPEASLERDVALDLLDLALCAEGTDPAALRALRRRRADQAWDLNERVAWLLFAASPPDDGPDAPALVEAALDARPDHPVALAAWLRSAALGRSDAAAVAARLRAAATSCEDPARRPVLAYRAARALSDLGADADARAFATSSLEGAPSVAGRWLLRALSSGGAAEAAHYRAATVRASADRRAWSLFAAAAWEPALEQAWKDLESLLAESPGHPGATCLFETLLWTEGGGDALLDLYQSEGADAPTVLVRNATLLAEAGRTEEAILALRRVRTSPPGTPIRPAARLAFDLGVVDLAAEILAFADTPEDRTERARLLVSLGRTAEAIPVLAQLSATGPDRVGVSARLATAAQQLGAHDVMIAAYATLAHESASPALRAAYGAWTAMQLQQAGRDREALEPRRVALAERPSSTGALLGVARGLVARKDADGLRRLFSMLRPESHDLLVEALYQAGDRAGAAEVAWRAEGDGRPRRLADVLLVERIREEAAQASGAAAAWQAVFDALGRRRELARAPEVVDDADARRRWILREKLSATDAAWDLYRALHQDSPDDPEITEALARIAGARGDVATAVSFLAALADRAPDRESAARYRRRIGAVREQAGELEAARQAYFDALDHVPDDAEALGALRRLAEQDQDWPSVVAILRRQVATATAGRQLDLRREIATITERHDRDPLVAMDAWRAVLELSPEDPEALDRLLALAEARSQWGVFVDAGQVRVRALTGAARAELLRRLGLACLDHLGREEGARFLLEATTGEAADLEASVRLEQHAWSRSDWPLVVRMLELQSRLHPGLSERVDALHRAARIQHDVLHQAEEAAATAQQVLVLDPDHDPSLRFLSTWLFERERFDEALPVFVRLEPRLEEGHDLDDFDVRVELANLWFFSGEVHRRAGRAADAVSRYARALERNPSHLGALEAVGPLLVASEQWSRAEGVYRQLLQLSGGQGDKSKVAEIYTQLGLVERRLGQEERAYKRFGKALELLPNHVGAMKGMALVLEDRGDWSNLLNVYNNVIYHASRPEDVIDAYMTKGRVLDDHMQRQDKAAQHYQRSLDFDPAQPMAHLRLAELALRRGAPEEAGELAEKGLALEASLVAPWRARLLVVRALARHAAGDAGEAERCLGDAAASDPAFVTGLGPVPLADPEAVRRAVKDSLAPTGTARA